MVDKMNEWSRFEGVGICHVTICLSVFGKIEWKVVCCIIPWTHPIPEWLY
jgi:hypothetical protein